MKPKLTVICVSFFMVLSVVEARISSRYTRQSAEWLQSEEGRRIADNVLTWQSPHGSWPKNQDTASLPFEGKSDDLDGTFDNGATTGELRFLARAFRATNEPRYKQAFLKGLDHIFNAQYPTGGWPQFYPPSRGYPRHITFNDNSMVHILEFLRDVAESSDYAFLETDRRAAARTAFDKGIQCILDCQIVVNGKRTVWCAQHDEVDLRPRPARSYELESQSGAESAAILKLLMSLDNPSPEIQRAIRAGATWYESVKITGIRLERVQGDRVVVEDQNAAPIWARFYEIKTNRPFFCGRDGVKKYRLSEIEAERRGGYSWYGGWGKDVTEAYDEWKEKWLGTEDAR
ncbi:MAG: pectate lyase [Planctomycetota bacterium]